MTNSSMRPVEAKDQIGFVGLSHLGLVYSAVFSTFGHKVIGIDADDALITQLSRGNLPVHEPGLQDLIAANRKRLKFTTDFQALQDCALVVFSLDVNTDTSNRADTTELEALVEQAIPNLSRDVALVIMSQVPVGFNERTVQLIQRSKPELNFTLVHWVETLVIGRAVERCLRPERIILGLADCSAPLPRVLENVAVNFGCPVLPMSYRSAELTKAAINLYLSASVTFANALSDLCEACDADMNELVPALRLDQRIGEFAYIRPGLGIAGGNLERDLISLQFLGSKFVVDTSFIDTIVSLNDRRYQWVHRQIERHVVAASERPCLAMWGLAYKRDTKSTKNSFALKLISELKGRFDLQVHDPVVELPEGLGQDVTSYRRRMDALRGADALIVMTDWPEYAESQFEAMAEVMASCVIIDCVGIIESVSAKTCGFSCISMGRSHDG